jgi:hypothetical protein
MERPVLKIEGIDYLHKGTTTLVLSLSIGNTYVHTYYGEERKVASCPGKRGNEYFMSRTLPVHDPWRRVAGTAESSPKIYAP